MTEKTNRRNFIRNTSMILAGSGLISSCAAPQEKREPQKKMSEEILSEFPLILSGSLMTQGECPH